MYELVLIIRPPCASYVAHTPEVYRCIRDFHLPLSSCYHCGSNSISERIVNSELFVFSMLASLASVFKTVVLIAIELHQYSSYCGIFGYCIRLLKFETFPSLPINISV